MAPATLATVTNAPGLWAALTAEAGLRPVRRRDGTENYDTALEMTVREELKLGHGPMALALRRADVTLEALIGAVLGGLRPWAAMLQDILAMLEEAEAAHAGQVIGLSVQWSRLAPDLQASLEAFRRWSDQANAVVGRAVGPQWGDLNLWDPRLMDWADCLSFSIT